MSDQPIALEEARARLEQAGYTVLKTASYRRAQERQRVAEVRVAAAEQRAEDARAWARDCLEDERRVKERLTFVWGVAVSRGATPEQLAADPLTRRPRGGL